MADPVTELATRLPCTFGILSEISSTNLGDTPVGPDDKLRITTSLASDSRVYIVQIEIVLTGDTVRVGDTVTRATSDSTTIWVMFPDDPRADPVRASASARVPPGDEWLVLPGKGKVRTFTASQPLYQADLVSLLGGREPLPGQVTVKNAKTKAGWP